jgi:hypothetical protein
MRDGKEGMAYIENMMEKLGAKHLLHMEMYGEDN